ncbi:hypothetical protein [Nocardia africana]
MQRFAVDCAAAGLPGADPDELVELRRYLATRVAPPSPRGDRVAHSPTQ